MNRLEVKKLNKSYKQKEQEQKILKNLNLRFESSHRYAIVGPSGSGKSTLLNILAGFDLNYEGVVQFNDFDLKSFSPDELANFKQNKIIYIKQNAPHFEKLSVINNLKINNLLDFEFNDYDLNLFNLNVKKTKKVNKLSGGEKQRVSILREIYKNAKIILADEATASLDYENASLVMNYLCSIAQDKIFIFVTHDEEIAKKYATDILEIKDGKIKKNYKRRVKEQDTYTPTERKSRIKFSKALGFANKLLKAEARKTSIFIGSFITGLLFLGLSLSLTSGFSSFFRNQINAANNTDIIYFSNNRSLEDLDYETVSQINIDLPNLDLYYAYNLMETFEISLTFEDNSDEEFILNGVNQASFTGPVVTTTRLLDDDHIILTYDGFGEDYLMEILAEDDFAEFAENNQFFLNIRGNGLDKIILIEDFLASYDYPNFTILHSNPLWNHQFLGDDLDYKICFDKTLSTEEKEYLSINNYCYFNQNANPSFIKKASSKIVKAEELSDYVDDVIPIYFNENNFWLNNYKGLFYFVNSSFVRKDETQLNELVYFDYHFPTLLIGSLPQPKSEEVIISQKLALELQLDLNEVGQEIELIYNDVPLTLTISGIADNTDTFSLYQFPIWYSFFYQENFQNSEELEVQSYLLMADSQKIQETIKNLKMLFSDYEIYSLLDEIYTTLDSVLNKINWGFYLLVLLNLIIAFASILVLSYLEIIDYEKQFELLSNKGFRNKDINKIMLALVLLRALFTAIIASFAFLFLAKIVNVSFQKLLEIDGDLLSLDPSIPLTMLLVTIGISLIVYLISSWHIKKSLP